MINLAGDDYARNDIEIRNELTRCGIDVIEGPLNKGEVRTHLEGRLGAFTFTRAWYYWVVRGLVPLKVAEELYVDPVGRTDIRVVGHCGCPPPEAPWTSRINPATGRTVVTAEKWNDPIYERHTAIKAIRDRDYEIEESPPQGAIFVTSYHIDSELGLFIFAQALRRHGLDAEPARKGGR